MKSRYVVLAVVFCATVILVAVFHKSALIRYHHWRLNVAKRSIEASVQPDHSSGFNVAGDEPTIEAFDYHLDRLADLGYFSRIAFTFDSVMCSTPQSKQIWNDISGSNDPKLFHATASAGDSDQRFNVTIWCEPRFEQPWIEFLEQRKQGE